MTKHKNHKKKEFNLSDKISNEYFQFDGDDFAGGHDIILAKDVKEFIEKLKENIPELDGDRLINDQSDFHEVIDNLAGKELIDNPQDEVIAVGGSSGSDNHSPNSSMEGAREPVARIKKEESIVPPPDGSDDVCAKCGFKLPKEEILWCPHCGSKKFKKQEELK